MEKENQSHLVSLISCTSCSFEQLVPVSRYKKGAKLKCPHCGLAITYEFGLIFSQHMYADIHPDSFMHPLDKNAIAALRRIPGLDLAIRKMMEYSYEKIIRVNSMADDVKVTPKTCGYIHDMAEQAAKTLGIPLPDVYVNQDPHPNAWTIGTEFPLIVIQSGLVELLNEDELYAVIAHEMGHIKCQHVLYHMLADFLRGTADALGAAGYVMAPVTFALLEWSRKSELSADRAALLVTNNKDSMIKLLMKLAGGSRHLSDFIDENEFVTQAAQFEELTKGIGLSKFYRVASNVTRTHPFPVLRAYAINDWAGSGEYAAICSGNYLKKTSKPEAILGDRKCAQCGQSMGAEDLYCQGCGQAGERLPNQYGNSGIQDWRDAPAKIKNWLGHLGNEKKQGPEPAGTGVCSECGHKFDDPAIVYCPRDGSKLIYSGGMVRRKCPKCGSTFDETEMSFCPEDGTPLVAC